MADLRKKFVDQIKSSTGVDVDEQSQAMKDRMTDAYEVASDWAENNSTALLAVGGGLLVAGLVTFFVINNRKKSLGQGQVIDKAA